MAEPKVRRDVERSRARRWVLLLVVPAVILMLAVPYLIDRDLETSRGPGAASVAPVDYQARRWVPSGAPLSVPDEEVVRVGTSRDGRALYVVRDPGRRGLGGGGGSASAERLPTSLLLVQIAEGAYQPLVAR